MMMKTRVRWTDLFTELMMGLFVVSSILWLSGAFSSVCSVHSFFSPSEKPVYLPPLLLSLLPSGSQGADVGDPELKPSLPLHHLLNLPPTTHTLTHSQTLTHASVPTSRHLQTAIFYPVLAKICSVLWGKSRAPGVL